MTSAPPFPAVAARFEALGTTAVVLVTEPAALDHARATLVAHVDVIDRACSRFRSDSELVAVNAAAAAGPVAVSDVLFEAVTVALGAAGETDGAVDPTMGSTMRELGYDRNFADIPNAGEPVRVTVRNRPGWRGVRLDRSRRTIELPAGVELDLGATAKAFCADRAAAAIRDSSGAGVLVSLGGDIAVAGPAPVGGWPVLVTDDHAAATDAPGQTIALDEGGLATSSTVVRRWSRGSAVLHHLLDPSTGRPAEKVWRTASVAAESCVAANTASTAAIVLGVAAPAWLTERGLPARLVADDGTVTIVGGWPQVSDDCC